MTAPAYQAEPWFAVLQDACKTQSQRRVALTVGMSEGAISQVINGTGFYGSGKASTRHLADQVVHRFGKFACPHLSELFEAPREITGAECCDYARGLPLGSPGAVAFWRACRACPHKAFTQPVVPRPHRPRKTPISPTPDAVPAGIAAPATEPGATPEEACS